MPPTKAMQESAAVMMLTKYSDESFAGKSGSSNIEASPTL